jgi:hypothetical protein
VRTKSALTALFSYLPLFLCTVRGHIFSFILPYLFKKVNENKKIRKSETTRAGVAFSTKAQRKKKCEKNLKIIEKNIENCFL